MAARAQVLAQQGVVGERVDRLLVERAGEEQAVAGLGQLAVARDVERHEVDAHRLQHVDVLEHDGLQRRPPGHRHDEVGGRGLGQQQAARRRRQKAAPRRHGHDLVELQVGGGLAAELHQRRLGRPRAAQRAHRAARGRVLAQELLGQLRRDVAEQRQAHVAAQRLLQLERRPPSRRRPPAPRRRSRAGSPGRACRRSAAAALAPRPRASSTRMIGASRRRARSAAREPFTPSQRSSSGRTPMTSARSMRSLHWSKSSSATGAGCSDGIEGARGPRGDVVDQAPERQVEAQQDGARGVLLAASGEQRAGHEVERGAGFDPGQDEARHRHRCERPRSSPRRAAPGRRRGREARLGL